MKPRLKKNLPYIIIGLLILGSIGIYVITDHIAPYAIVLPYRVNLEQQVAKGRFPNGIHPKDYQLKYTDVSITTQDSIRLKGYFIQPKEGISRGTIILLHGIGGCKEHYLGLSKLLTEQGMSCLIFDARAHGESDGKYCTYGYREKYDVKAIVDYLKAHHPSEPIGIWGNSMGGAIALQAMEIDKRITFGIVESTFTEMRVIVSDYQKQLFGFRSSWISNRALNNAAKIAYFNPDSVRPIQSVPKIDQPILINHGNADKKIALNYGKLLFKNLNSKEKELHIIDGAGHENLYEMGGQAYMDAILAFLNRHMPKIEESHSKE
ncbi:alpha/beta hydrolase [Spongiimicrobium salis]|uniref:alpha/beta hydrolase n=1 Tax=Spongiimicrobium salis TaxID=1667022 RepID=UPI00374DB003